MSFSDFIVRHWDLFLAFVVILGIIIGLEIRLRPRGHALSPQQAVLLINRENALVVDIRSPEMFLQGHIAKALNISAEELVNHKKLARYQDKPVLVYCEKGVSCLKAVKALEKADYKKLYTLQRGLQEWRSNNLPLEKGN